MVPAEWADPEIALPVYQTAGAAGADVKANLKPDAREGGISIAPGERALVPLGIILEIPPQLEVQIRSRSGLALKSGVMVLNAPGTVDSDYRGEVGVILANFGKDDFVVRHGERIAQIVVAPVTTAKFSRSIDFATSARGTGGFGSTGKE